MNKSCFKCGAVKPIAEFYAHSKMADGHLNKCKECTCRDVNARYVTARDKIVAYERKRAKTPERRAKRLAYTKAKRRRDPMKAKAWRAVAYAVRSGKLRPLPCEICGAAKTQAHHDDYSKPLAVRWLCFTCHRTHAHGQTVSAA